ncbi:MAG TPA: hypothetical protein VEC12_08250, partial [Bacteroidia bacterium]|nr:hypothetical protein [Bacteroidia bacterium]
MLLRSLCIVALFYLPHLAESQVFQRGDFAIGPMYQVHMLGKTRSFEAVYGIQASFFIRDHISLDYSLGYTTVPLAPNYYKVYGGGVLGGYGIIMAANSYNISTEAWWALTVLSL